MYLTGKIIIYFIVLLTGSSSLESPKLIFFVLEFQIVDGAGIGQDVTDVTHTSNVENQTLEA